MRVLSLLLITFSLVFSVNLTPEQLQMAKAAGYSPADIQKQLAKQPKPTTNKGTQVVNNNIIKSNNLFKTTSNIGGVEKDKKPESIKKVKRYGALFFNNKNKLNPYSIPTPSNYNLNFGDKISLTVYGSTNQDFELSIDNNGNVLIPQVGELQIIGLSFSEAKDLIVEESRKAYPNSTNILVDMSEYASIQVTISGFVNAPGLYNLSSFSTIKDALIASGGILENGSYRNIYLKRDGRVEKVFDLYQLVRYGNTNSDEMLQNGDVVLVKPINKEVILTGDVNYNASYELKNNESFKDLINYAAGFKPRANKNAIKLKRYESNTLKVYTISKNELYKMKPKSGDEVHIYPTSTVGAKLVEIKGNVVAPGERELPKDKKLSSLLKKELKHFGVKSYFKKNTNYDYAVVKNDNNINTFNLQKVLDGNADITLKISDEIIVYRNDDLQEKPYIYVFGEVVDTSKQKYTFFEGLKAVDLFGLVRFKNDTVDDGKRKSIKVDRSKIQISRIVNNKKEVYLIAGKELSSFMLKKFDDVKFFEYSKVNNITTATIKGEVFIPGTYNISNNTKFRDIVDLVGGFTKKALYSRFEIARYSIVNDERQRKVLSLDLNKAMDLNIDIYPDDEITIFPIAKWNETKYVTIKGLVKYPGTYPIVEGEKLSSVLERAGGFLDEAFVEGIVFTREEIRKLQQKRLEESIDRLKSKIFQSNLSAKEAGESGAQEKQDMVNTIRILEKESKINKPIGRISLNIYHDLNRFKTSKYDITLKNKDTLHVPSINDTVSVVGEVLNQNTFVYDDELDITEYIKKSGGITDSADEEFIYVVKANGEAVKHERNFFWEESTSVFKGDTIVIPLKVDVISDISYAKDVTQILYQLAITAASLKTVGGI